MKRTEITFGPVTPETGSSQDLHGRLAHITWLGDYRRRSRLRRTVRAAGRFLSRAAEAVKTIPSSFWIGVVAGLLASAMVLIATGHGRILSGQARIPPAALTAPRATPDRPATSPSVSWAGRAGLA